MSPARSWSAVTGRVRQPDRRRDRLRVGEAGRDLFDAVLDLEEAVERAWAVLATVADPEIPVISVVDLGIVLERISPAVRCGTWTMSTPLLALNSSLAMW